MPPSLIKLDGASVICKYLTWACVLVIVGAALSSATKTTIDLVLYKHVGEILCCQELGSTCQGAASNSTKAGSQARSNHLRSECHTEDWLWIDQNYPWRNIHTAASQLNGANGERTMGDGWNNHAKSKRINELLFARNRRKPLTPAQLITSKTFDVDRLNNAIDRYMRQTTHPSMPYTYDGEMSDHSGSTRVTIPDSVKLRRTRREARVLLNRGGLPFNESLYPPDHLLGGSELPWSTYPRRPEHPSMLASEEDRSRYELDQAKFEAYIAHTPPYRRPTQGEKRVMQERIPHPSPHPPPTSKRKRYGSPTNTSDSEASAARALKRMQRALDPHENVSIPGHESLDSKDMRKRINSALRLIKNLKLERVAAGAAPGIVAGEKEVQSMLLESARPPLVPSSSLPSLHSTLPPVYSVPRHSAPPMPNIGGADDESDQWAEISEDSSIDSDPPPGYDECVSRSTSYGDLTAYSLDSVEEKEDDSDSDFSYPSLSDDSSHSSGSSSGTSDGSETDDESDASSNHEPPGPMPPFIGPVLPPDPIGPVPPGPAHHPVPGAGALLGLADPLDPVFIAPLHQRHVDVFSSCNTYYASGTTNATYRVLTHRMGGLYAYQRGTQDYSGNVQYAQFDLRRPGAVLRGYRELSHGHYTHEPLNTTITTTPWIAIKNFVTDARARQWLVSLRSALDSLVDAATLHQLDGPRFNPFHGLATRRRHIMASKFVYSYLLTQKIASTLTPENATLLTRLVFREFPDVPTTILVDTLLLFAHERASVSLSTTATTTALLHQVSRGSRVRSYLEPANSNATNTAIVMNEHDLTTPGIHELTNKKEADEAHRRGVTVAYRQEYADSAQQYGSSLTPTIPAGNKYAATPQTRKYNKNCGFQDPYPVFTTRDPPDMPRPYVSGCPVVACRVQRVNHLSTTETERMALRFTAARPNEMLLRAQQIETIAAAYNDHLADPGELALTQLIRQNDPLYTPDIVPTTPRPTFNQRVIRDMHRLYCQAVVPPNVVAGIIADPIASMRNYITEVGGRKQKQRLRELELYRNDPNPRRNRVSVCQIKKHECQKIKAYGLKHARATISLTGSSWIQQDPAVMYGMKKLCEGRLYISPTAAGSTFEYITADNALMQQSQAQCRTHALIYALLSETTLEDKARHINGLINFVSQGRHHMAGMVHGDDIIVYYTLDDPTHIYSFEADISDNDTSYTDTLMRLDYQRVSAQGLDGREIFAQQANPLIITNPACADEVVCIRRLLGMSRDSGSTNTTAGNSFGSLYSLGLLAFHGFSALAPPPDAIFADMGFNITSKTCSIFQSTFLSSFIYRNPAQPQLTIACMTDPASIFRNLGYATGDLPGRTKLGIRRRYLDYMMGVIKGYVHEPPTLFMRILRDKYAPTSVPFSTNTPVLFPVLQSNDQHDHPNIVHLPVLPRITNSSLYGFGAWLGPSISRGGLDRHHLTYHDHGIIEHYYPHDLRDEGIEQYLTFCNQLAACPKYGFTIASAFVDVIMYTRYHLDPVSGPIPAEIIALNT